jgi:hypothetical protein
LIRVRVSIRVPAIITGIRLQLISMDLPMLVTLLKRMSIWFSRQLCYLNLYFFWLILKLHSPTIDWQQHIFNGAIDNSLTLPLDIKSKHFQENMSFRNRRRYWGNWHDIHMSVASDVKTDGFEPVNFVKSPSLQQKSSFSTNPIFFLISLLH